MYSVSTTECAIVVDATSSNDFLGARNTAIAAYLDISEVINKPFL